MKLIYVLSFLLASLVAANGDGETYTTENDDFDIDAAVADTVTFKGLIDCLLDRGSCNAVGTDFKSNVPEAVETACAKCTDAQKRISHKFLEALKSKNIQDHEAFKTRFDPSGINFPKFLAAIAKY